MEKNAILESMEKAILDGNTDLGRQGANEAIQQQMDPLEVVEMGR